MANWTYSDWRRQSTPALQLARLALHIEEVEERLDVELSADSHSRSSNALQQRLDRLEELYKDFEKRAGATSSTQITRVMQVRLNQD